ncbi:hypothetical protein [Kutzneria kofuensis]|uniref:Tetratricopeptide repeat protein n=1 Tax=Kutzneria kofuensis TaxID=103725 RepID=A0A7W9KNS1_9PSEU|nr:hypothetical protein [Kutzneria kofuensis]MBB5895980.1 hypothetical protein [Kutzneria kofuensis]
MDPNNQVVRLIGQGMQADGEGRADDARALFEQAWDAATDDYEACLAAHYLARSQQTPEEVLQWNKVCLERADKSGDERVRAFYASMHLSLARAHTNVDDADQAREHYKLAADSLQHVPAGPHHEAARFAIARGLDSTSKSAALAELLGKLSARGDLLALGLLLPAYLRDLGTAEDRTALLMALQTVRVDRHLPEDEQEILARAVAEVTESAKG